MFFKKEKKDGPKVKTTSFPPPPLIPYLFSFNVVAVGKKNKTLTSFSFVEISELEVKGLIFLIFFFHSQ